MAFNDLQYTSGRIHVLAEMKPLDEGQKCPNRPDDEMSQLHQLTPHFIFYILNLDNIGTVRDSLQKYLYIFYKG